MIRGFVCDTRALVQTAYEHHDTYPVVTAALGRSLTAATMMGVMQKNEDEKLTLKIDGNGPIGNIVVTANSQAIVKGYASNPHVDIPLKPSGKLDVSAAVGKGSITVIKDLGLKEPYVGTTDIISGEIAEDITYYFSVSEQVPSSVGLGVLVDTDLSVKRAGGFILQLMPSATDEVIDKLESNISKVTSVTALFEEEGNLEAILGKLLEGFDVEITDEIVPKFECGCSKEKVRDALSLIKKEEIRSMIDDGQPVEVHCDFCNTYYKFEIDELKAILEK
jgi:molecular chaperone Hsp33